MVNGERGLEEHKDLHKDAVLVQGRMRLWVYDQLRGPQLRGELDSLTVQRRIQPGAQ